MTIVKNIFTTIVNIISKPVYFFASFASILGFVFLLFRFRESWVVYVVVGYFCILMTVFDKITKSYEYHLLLPEIGYFYRIRWKKN